MGYASYDEDEDTMVYKIVVNDEEQYCLWPVGRDNPLGWRDEGKTGGRGDCIKYVDEVWTDMRPLSLREELDLEPDGDE